MNHRLLLGSTALVSAGVLFAGAAPAKAQGQTPITVTLSGYTEVGLRGATGQTLTNGAHDQGYTGFMDTEIHIQATGKTDSGVTYGSYVELDVYGNEEQDGGTGPTQTSVIADEANLFFSGGFGRIELGRQDGAEDVMFVGAEDAQSGTGGIDGDTSNLASVYHISNGDFAKAIYYTPRVAGFQLGADWGPSKSDNQGINQPNEGGAQGNSVGAGANWVGSFGGVDLTLSTTAAWTHANGNIPDPQRPGNTTDKDQKDAEIGGLLGVGGLSFGVTAGRNFDFNEGNFIDGGLKYGFGAASASLGYVNWNPDHGNTQNVFVVSGDVGLMPGVTLKGDVSYNDEDPFAHNNVNKGSDSTWAGVLSVQMDY
jgi:outer membrane protein OmpU